MLPLTEIRIEFDEDDDLVVLFNNENPVFFKNNPQLMMERIARFCLESWREQTEHLPPRSE